VVLPEADQVGSHVFQENCSTRVYRALAVSAGRARHSRPKAGCAADFGDPLPFARAAGLFVAGKEEFQTVETAAEGSGPVSECRAANAIRFGRRRMKDLVETRFEG
jgi:hypothetical protein